MGMIQDSLDGKEGIAGVASPYAASSLKAAEYYQSITYQQEDLTTTFSPLYEVVGEWLARPKACYNLTAGVINTISTLYYDPVVRTFENERAQNLWKSINGWETLMQDVDKYTELCGLVAVRPVVLPNALKIGGIPKINFAVYRQENIEYTPDPIDPSVCQEVKVSWEVTDAETTTSYSHIWSAEKFATIKDGIVQEVIDNPYGFIPFVFFGNSYRRWSFWDRPADDLVQSNLALNAMTTDLNWTTKWQSHGQLVLVGAPPEFVPKIGPCTYIKVKNEPGAGASYIQPGANIQAIIDATNFNLTMFFSGRRIPESAVIAKQTDSSGVALVAQQSSLRDYRKKRINAFRPQEAELISMTLSVLETHATGVRVAFEAPSMVYTELKAPLSNDEREDWSWRFDHRAATPIDFILTENPEMDRPSAEALWAKNNDFLVMASLSKMPNVDMPAETTPDEMPAEEPEAKAPVADESVQDTALNGAQVTALQGIVESVIAGKLSKPAAILLIEMSFPNVPKEMIVQMINEVEVSGEPTEENAQDDSGDATPEDTEDNSNLN